MFFSGFRRDVRYFLGSILARFGHELGGVSAFRVLAMSRTVAADVQATGRDRTVITKAGKRYFFLWFPGSEGTFRTIWARFWRCSVLQGHCVSPSSRVRFQPREEEQQQQQEQQEGSMSYCTNSDIKSGRKV